MLSAESWQQWLTNLNCKLSAVRCTLHSGPREQVRSS
jgi:hypothetical protein